VDPRQAGYGSTRMGGAERDDRAGLGDRGEAERTVRTGIAEIEEAIERLERTCRQGRITRGELMETRSVLELQRERLDRQD
jgi:hypothetical protein